MLILPIRFSVVACDPVCISTRSRILLSTCNLSMQSIIHSLEETFSQVEVTNRIYRAFKMHTSRNLAISMAPMMLNSFHVPLVDNNDNLFMRTSVNLFEQTLVSFVDKDSLQLRKENV
jgi:hypothetical protein